MHPELRAIADRFVYEQATLKHIATLVPEGGLARPVPGYDWTVSQLLAHLAQSLQSYREVVERWLAGEDPFAGVDLEAVNAETAAAHATATVADLHRLFGDGLNGLVAALAQVPEDRVAGQLGRYPAIETLRRLSGHSLSHAIALADAVPEVRMDPLVLNWLLDAEFDDETSKLWQDRLLQDARAYIATLQDDDEDEE